MSSDDDDGQEYTYEEVDDDDEGENYVYNDQGDDDDDEEEDGGGQSTTGGGSSSANPGSGSSTHQHGPVSTPRNLLRVLVTSLDDCRMDLMGNDDVEEAQLTVVGDWGKLRFDLLVNDQVERQEYTLTTHESSERGQTLQKVEVGANTVAKMGPDRSRALATVVNLYLPPLINAGSSEGLLEEYLKEATAMAFALGEGDAKDAESFTATLIQTAKPLFRSKNMAYRLIKSLIFFMKHLDDLAFCPKCGLQGGQGRPHAPCVSREALAERLKNFFLSPRAMTRSSLSVQDTNTLPVLDDDRLLAIMKKYCPDISRIRDRTGVVPAYTYIISTYKQGLPNFQGLPSLQQHTIGCLRYIFSKIETVADRDGKSLMNQIVDSFRSCQAEQGRVIDAVYGALSGRDKSFQTQLLTIVDAVRQRALDTATMKMRGGQVAINMGAQDMPHVQNGYKMAFGKEMGFSEMQMEAARSDRLAHVPDAGTVERVKTEMREAFTIHDVAEAIMVDVNQQDPEAQRVVDRDSLAKWASSVPSFNAHSIYYDETHPKAYKDAKPRPENRYQPFLSLDVAYTILLRAFHEQLQ